MHVVAGSLAQADDGVVFRIAIQGLVGSSARPSAAPRPLFALATRQAVQLAGWSSNARTSCVPNRFQQLQAGRMAFRVDAQGFLGISSPGHRGP